MIRNSITSDSTYTSLVHTSAIQSQKESARIAEAQIENSIPKTKATLPYNPSPTTNGQGQVIGSVINVKA